MDIAGRASTTQVCRLARISSASSAMRLASRWLEVRIAKTAFQRERSCGAPREAALPGSRRPIATPEDLIVLKFIAKRPKDHVDLLELVQRDALDWPYVERWAAERASQIDCGAARLKPRQRAELREAYRIGLTGPLAGLVPTGTRRALGERCVRGAPVRAWSCDATRRSSPPSR